MEGLNFESDRIGVHWSERVKVSPSNISKGSHLDYEVQDEKIGVAMDEGEEGSGTQVTHLRDASLSDH
jgi:hypothetical protein